MDKRGFSRLQEENLKVIEDTKRRISKWEKFVEDYETLQERLVTLPKKLTHNVMVPITNVAFMPGHLYHTNEVLVLLGDNWFAERSAHEAYEIVERRMKFVREELEKERIHLKELSSQHSLASSIENLDKDVIEITEEYDPAKEEERKRARKLKKREGTTTKGTQQQSNNETEIKTDAELWARLEELEREEEREAEKLKQQPKKTLKQKIMSTSKSDKEQKEKTKESLPNSPSSVIYFSHSISPQEKTDTHTSGEKTDTHTSAKIDTHTSTQTDTHTVPKYTSPADIISGIRTRDTRGEGEQKLLKENRKEEEKVEREKKSVHWSSDDHKTIKQPIRQPPSLAFTGKVVVRQTTSPSVTPPPPPPSSQQDKKVGEVSNEASGGKKVSRFKASRSK